jgi:hypothetical protein
VRRTPAFGSIEQIAGTAKHTVKYAEHVATSRG